MRTTCGAIPILIVSLAVAASTSACGSSNQPGEDRGHDSGRPLPGDDGGLTLMDAGHLQSQVDGAAAESGSITPPPGACGINSEVCHGSCIQTFDDPNNCGACGKTCPQGTVCTASACQPASACPPGTTVCGQTCVDTTSDNAHCGSCEMVCPRGQGCAGSTCVPAVNRDAGANAPSCSGGAGLGDAGLACTPGVLFPWGICACNEITSSYPITTDSFNSLDGGYGVEAGLGGGVGVNGELTTSSTFNVGGSLWVGATSGLARSANGDAVGLELHSNGPLQGTGTFGVGLNAYVNGDVAGAVTVGGTLDVPESASVASNVTAQSVVRGPVAVPSPCACDPSHLLDIQGLVEAAEQSNDDAAIGLAPDTLANVVGGARLDLPCGKYYLAGIGGPGPIAIAVHGRTSVFVLGDFIVSGAIEVTIDPQATLDLFISENLQGSGQLKLGSTAVPSQSRIYVGGSTVGLSNVDSVFAGNLYAPLASFGHSAATAVYGSLFVGGYAASGSLTVHYDSAILAAGNECGGAGAPPSCKTCEDCGNQACVGGKCGSCTTSADCCAPLLCQNGSCVQTPAPK